MSTSAIVTTVRNPEASFAWWLEYHLHWVDRIFVFLDFSEPTDRPIPLHPRIEVHPGSPYHRFKGGNGTIERQCQNAKVALQRCKEEAIDWLIHIDSDELLYSNSGTLQQYLDVVPDNITQVSFWNHEAVALPGQIKNPFTECKVFKHNGKGKDFFVAYGNGKCMARVDTIGNISGVHNFTIAHGETKAERDICILHYPSVDFDRWYAKFKTLGDFPDFWWNNRSNPVFPFMRNSRDAVKQGENAARQYWQSELLGEKTIEIGIADGRFFRLDRLSMKESPNRSTSRIAW